MTEFQELVKDAPKFASMERGELVTYAYAMYAAGAKTDSENAKLRELVADVHEALCSDKAGMFHKLILASMEDDMCELGVEVD